MPPALPERNNNTHSLSQILTPTGLNSGCWLLTVYDFCSLAALRRRISFEEGKEARREKARLGFSLFLRHWRTSRIQQHYGLSTDISENRKQAFRFTFDFFFFFFLCGGGLAECKGHTTKYQASQNRLQQTNYGNLSSLLHFSTATASVSTLHTLQIFLLAVENFFFELSNNNDVFSECHKKLTHNAHTY